MTITDMPRRARAAVRLSGGHLVSRVFAPWLVNPRKLSRRGMFSPSAADVAADGKMAAAALSKAVGNSPLGSLAGGTLAGRFHAWWGISGRRYICSVFPIVPDAPDFGLPEFAEAIVLAVACSDSGDRHLLAACLFETATEAAERQRFIEAAGAAGAKEMHIHLLTEDRGQRCLVVKDIESRITPGSIMREDQAVGA